MNDFSFVVVSYNQEKYVLQHLRTIKFQIKNYGADKKIQIIFSDDASKDKTVEIAERWLGNNSDLFSNIKVIRHDQNVGTIRNMYEAISAVEAKAYKMLACDDLYFTNNIFELMGLANIVLTPTISFWNNGDIESFISPDYCTLLRCSHNRRKKIDDMLKYNQCIPSPGVFMDQQFWRDVGFVKYLMQFKYIEDIPEWDYIFSGKYSMDFSVVVSRKPYILYRRAAGVSQNILRSNTNPIDQEYTKIRKLIPAREDIKPIILNSYRIAHYINIHFLNKLWLLNEDKNGNLKDWEKGIQYTKEYLKEVVGLENEDVNWLE